MKSNPIPLITVCLLVSISSLAQIIPSQPENNSRYNLLLRSGVVIPEKNISTERLSQFNNRAARTAQKTFAIIQFEQLPTENEKLQLKQSGIDLLDYIPDYAYTVTISGSLDAAFLNQVKARAVIELSAQQKMQPELSRGDFPSWAVKVAGTVDVWISFPKSFSFETVQLELKNKNLEIISTQYKEYRIIALRVAVQRLGELALLPFIEYVQAAPAEDQPVNYNSMFASRANALKASVANGGRNLTGQGVVVGIGDNGDIQTHLDFTNRIINRSGEVPAAHTSHVAGTIGGAGIIQELYAGFAPKSTLLSQFFSNIITYAPAYVQDNGMVITNNSYGSVVNDCAYNGLYDLTARILDQQAFDLPELQHVFAAGNDGGRTCAPNPAGFRTVLGGYQSAKNILTVGSTDYKRDLSAFSSRGPVRDGRLKPEIMSQGQFVASTWVSNLYSYNNGTSMAAPGVSGGLALLIQRYRQLNSGANPKNALMKALLCNGASDRGNAGPDFRFGFGSMNLIRSLKMMEDVTYFGATVNQASANTHNITVPANTAQLKVLLYWQDPPAAVMASKTLVNDLDLEVISPGSTVLPLKLDTLAANLNVVATNGADRINNIEQVVINNPVAGSYSLRAIGTMIAQNPSQQYFLVYDIIPNSLVLTNPVGGEAFTPTGTYFFGAQVFDTMYVQWDDDSSPANEMLTIEFSSDGGSSWSTLSGSIPSSQRFYKWVIPATPTALGKIRLSKNNTLFTQTSNSFVITALPVVSLASAQCEGYISINWAAIPGANDYEAMMLRGDEMVSMGTTTALNFIFSGLSKDSVYWVTVRPRINGKPGRRAVAVSRQPNTGTCAGNISDNDLVVDAIISPTSSGRIFTSTALSSSIPVTIRIKNLDDVVSAGDINVSYSINGGPPVSAVITSPLADIPSGGFIDYTFSTNANFSAVGTYNIQVTATKTTDPVVINNSITKTFKQLDNQPITLAQLPWIDNFETVPVQTVLVDQMGLTGRDRYDFFNSTSFGRVRSFINSGIAYSGSKALTLDMDRYLSGGNVDSLTATFNMATINPATDDIRLDFRYKNHNQKTNPANKVWIRGSENNSWILVYDMFTNQNIADGSYKLSGSIELSDSLAAYGQTFSSSFQVRWAQWGQYMTADNESAAGYSFDDIRLYRAVNDIQMVNIDEPVTVGCGLNNAVVVKVRVHNSTGGIVNNIPVVLKVDGTTIATENVPSIPANSSVQYTFTARANLAANGNHNIESWVNLPTDSFRENDSARITVKNLPIVTSFPYLQNFESGNGSWYTGGTSSSWEYGTPVSPKINRAASGSKVWKTNLTGYYNDDELSYLYSPCFDMSGMTNPMLSFSLALDIEDCGASLCDAAWVEYSTNGGTSWTKLGATGQGTNWYNKNYSGNQLWSQQNYIRWHVATSALPIASSLRLRFVFDSDNGLAKDGIAVDDIHIYENVNGIYDGLTMASPVSQNITGGNNWVNFLSGGKLVASIQPSNQNMGNTDVQAYINTAAVRNLNGQYYHNRNITVKPTNEKLNDSVRIRIYFLDSESELLISATGCPTCSKPASAYDLGISKYSDSLNQFENGQLADDTLGNWNFIISPQIIKVPFLNGYYFEGKIKDFSEFWLNDGGPGRVNALRAEFIAFRARKISVDNVQLDWTMRSENNIMRYEIEVAKGVANFQAGQFSKIGEASGAGNSIVPVSYSYTDAEANKSGSRYYRLKVIYADGGFTYSPVQQVVFYNGITIQVYPNPSRGVFNIAYQLPSGQTFSLQVIDVTGKLIQQQNFIASGFPERKIFDFSSRIYPNGMYLLRFNTNDQQQVIRMIKQ